MACKCTSPKSDQVAIAPPPNGIAQFGYEWKNWLHDLWEGQGELIARVTNIELGDFAPIGFQTISDVSTATGLTVPTDATKALIQVLGNDANWRDDGTSPTVGVGGGFQLSVQDSMLYSADLDTIEFIETVAAATARINIVYYI